MEQLPELMTPAEVAEVLRLTDETVHRWARIGKLPYINVHGIKRFRRSDVEALLRGETPVSGAA